MLHRASLVPSSDRGWITATFCITACPTRTSRSYRECRILLHELSAKLHDANITQPSFLRISIGYRCVAESTTRLPSSIIKPSNCSNLRILLVFSRQTVACSEVIYVRHTFNTLFIDKHGCSLVLMLRPHRLEQSSPFVCTADSFTSFRSQLKTYTFARHL